MGSYIQLVAVYLLDSKTDRRVDRMIQEISGNPGGKPDWSAVSLSYNKSNSVCVCVCVCVYVCVQVCMCLKSAGIAMFFWGGLQGNYHLVEPFMKCWLNILK